MTAHDAKLLLYQISDVIDVAAKFLETANETESVKAVSVLRQSDNAMEKLMEWLDNRGWELEE